MVQRQDVGSAQGMVGEVVRWVGVELRGQIVSQRKMGVREREVGWEILEHVAREEVVGIGLEVGDEEMEVRLRDGMTERSEKATWMAGREEEQWSRSRWMTGHAS